MENIVKRELPGFIEGYGEVRPFRGACAIKPTEGQRYHGKLVKNSLPTDNKVVSSLKEVIKKIGIKDGMSLGFHHALRNGDYVINMVLQAVAELGIKDIKVVSTALFPVHEPIIEHMRSGVVTGLDVPGIVGPVGEAVSKGILEKPVVFRSHGARPRAMMTGELRVDVAFLAAPAADIFGNINGVEGPSACGALGYAFTDADYADVVVAVTDYLKETALKRISISQDKIDYVVEVDKIGDPSGIVSGVLNITKDPLQLLIAERASQVTDALGLLKDGFSFQTGGGGVSLAYAQFITKIMEERNIVASHAMGGVTELITDLLERGMLETIFDNQCFDLAAVESIKRNTNHIEVSASMYANPYNAGNIVNTLDQCILGALEIDTDFNLNVLTGADGMVRAGIGGNQDTAAGSRVTMVTANLLRGRIPVVVDQVQTICTPGETVDVVVTESGIAVNPLRPELAEKIEAAGLPLVTIEYLKEEAYKLSGKPDPLKREDRIIGVVEYRDGSVLDVIRKVGE